MKPRTWVQATLDGNFVVCWGGLDPEFGLAIVQEWVTSNSQVLELVPGVDRDGLAGELAVVTPTHEVWQEHGRRVLQRNVERLVEGLEGVRYGHGIKPRFVAPDLEVIVFFDLDSLPVDEYGGHHLPAGEGRLLAQ